MNGEMAISNAVNTAILSSTLLTRIEHKITGAKDVIIQSGNIKGKLTAPKTITNGHEFRLYITWLSAPGFLVRKTRGPCLT
jgi:hypothetical protein